MCFNRPENSIHNPHKLLAALVGVMILALAVPVNIFSVNPMKPVRPQRRTNPEWPDTIALSQPVGQGAEVVGSTLTVSGDSVSIEPVDTIAVIVPPELDRTMAADTGFVFNPNPTRAVWMSVLFPGLGQIYNRSFWKLPIIIGGFMGLGYATSWNNGMLRDYTRAYSDIMDSDPSTKSYMDFFPPTTQESDLDREWLTNVLKSRKDYYRRNRDLCIICMVGVYLLSIVDAYVDASLSHFDISPTLSMDVSPTLIPDRHSTRYPGVGVQWALNF